MKTNKLKILHVHDYPPFEGGCIEIMVSNISEEFVKKGCDVTIATSRFKSETFGQKSEDETRNGVKGVLVNHMLNLQSLIGKSDVVNIHFTFSCRPATISALEICNRIGKKCIVTIHTNYEHIPFSALATLNNFEINAKLYSLSKLISSDNVYLAGPAYDVKRSLGLLGVSKELKVIRNSVHLNKLSDVKFKIDKVDITYIGEVSFMKGINYLIDAINIARNKLLGIRVRIIGGGSDLSHINLMIKFFKLENNIEITGYVPHASIRNYLASTKIYVHPSLTETWANAVAEALLMKIPVICTDVGGLYELID